MALEDAGRMAVVVVNFASSELLEANLSGLGDGFGADSGVEIVVVDNFSGPGERRRARESAARHGWAFVAMPDNRGFSAAVNAGLAAARSSGCTSFLLLNPDAVVGADVVLALRRDVEDHRLDLVSPRVVASEGGWTFEGSAMDLTTGRSRRLLDPATLRPHEFPWATAACLAFHDDLLRRVGDLEERFFMYWEDVDLSLRAVRAGGNVRVRRDLVAAHDEGGTQVRRGRAKSLLYYRYNTRNRLLFAALHLERRDVWRWIALSPRIGLEILLRGGRRQLLRSARPLAAVVAGTVAGVAAATPALATRRTGPTGPPADGRT